jgi:DNA primase
VVLVEGFFDCLKCTPQASMPALVALMGTALYSSQQRLLLERFCRVIVNAGNGDDAGRRATGPIIARLQQHASVRLIQLPDAVQPDQLSTEGPPISKRQFQAKLDDPLGIGKSEVIHNNGCDPAHLSR